MFKILEWKFMVVIDLEWILKKLVGKSIQSKSYSFCMWRKIGKLFIKLDQPFHSHLWLCELNSTLQQKLDKSGVFCNFFLPLQRVVGYSGKHRWCYNVLSQSGFQMSEIAHIQITVSWSIPVTPRAAGRMKVGLPSKSSSRMLLTARKFNGMATPVLQAANTAAGCYWLCTGFSGIQNFLSGLKQAENFEI